MKHRRPTNAPDDPETWSEGDTASTRNSEGTAQELVVDEGLRACDCCPTDPPPDSRRYQALGDAVTVPVAEWVGRRLMEASSSC